MKAALIRVMLMASAHLTASDVVSHCSMCDDGVLRAYLHTAVLDSLVASLDCSVVYAHCVCNTVVNLSVSALVYYFRSRR